MSRKTLDKKNPTLRQHQKEALSAIRKVINKGEGKGRIILPTGTGKTFIEAHAVCDMIHNAEGEWKENWGGVHVVLSPRILLAYQQLNEFLEYLSRENIECDYMVVNSGGLNSADYEKKLLKLGFDNPEEIDSTTNVDAIVSRISQSREAKVPLVIFSTYHSAGNVDAASKKSQIKVQSYIFDEAQYCVTSGDFQDVPNFDSFFKFFFTATEKWTSENPTDDGLGMQNETKFGKILFTEKPRTLIDRGEMASVAIHLVGTRGKKIEDNDYESMAKVMLDAFEKHRTVVKNHSFMPDAIGPKMVVVCDKQDSLKGIMRSKTLKAYKLANQGVNLCALSSNFGIEVNGEFTPRANNKNKEMLLGKMKNWKPEEEAIVLHVDMISEGLDIPGLTAIMPFRNLGKIKFLQNVGRGTRLIKADKERLYMKDGEEGKIFPKDWKQYIKPYCWLILPILSDDYYDMKRRYSDYIYALRSEGQFISSDTVVIDNIVGPAEVELTDDLVGNVEKKFFTGKGVIDEIIHGIEDGEAMSEFMDNVFAFNTLDASRQVAMLQEIYAAS